MSSADAAVGIMDGAYFVGRKELLDFFNNLLDLNITKIEQTAPGAIACQITEMMFPGSINMTKVNWEAKTDYEFVQNYKLLQVAFTKHSVQRYVDVDKLIRAKYQDNLEFCQWLKAFYDQTAPPRGFDYDPAAVRAKGKGGKKYNQMYGRTALNKTGTLTSKPTTTSTAASTARTSLPLRERASLENGTSSKVGTVRPAARTTESEVNLVGGSDVVLLQKKNAELNAKVADLEVALEEVERDREQIVMDVERERDFYFGKLRSVEVLLQVHQESGGALTDSNLVDRVFQILYATAEDNLTVNEQGQVVVNTTDPQQEEDVDALLDDV